MDFHALRNEFLEAALLDVNLVSSDWKLGEGKTAQIAGGRSVAGICADIGGGHIGARDRRTRRIRYRSCDRAGILLRVRSKRNRQQ